MSAAFDTARLPARRQPLPATTATASRPGAAEGGEGWLEFVLVAGMVGGAVLAVMLGQASMARLAYAGAAPLIAGWLLFTRRHGAYVGFCLWLFVVSSGVRRYVDLEAGWQAVNLVLLAPWLAAAPTLLVVFHALIGRGLPFPAGLLAVVTATCYGLALAVLDRRLFAGGFDWLRWTVPPCFAGFVALVARADPTLPARVLRCLGLAVAITGAYGIWQYVALPPWDAFWMRNVEMASIGQPEPYEVRVFSLLNSPGPLGNFLLVGLVYLFAFATPLRLGALVLGSVALLLSLNRSAWGATALAGAWLVLLGPFSLKLRAGLALAALAVAVPLAFQVPEMALTVEERMDSIRYLLSDASYHERLYAYAEFLRIFGENLIGQGLAITGAYQSHLGGNTVIYIDGQVIEVFLALGLVFGTLYLLGALACLGGAIAAGLRSGSRFGLASSAVALGALALLAYGSPLTGESGIFFWLGVALCFTPAAFSPFWRVGR